MNLMHPSTQSPWCVFDNFDFLIHVLASSEAEARQAAAEKTGLAKQLTVFLEGDSVTTYASRNTFSLFQQHGGLSMSWKETYRQAGPISRDDFRSLIDCMKAWVVTPEAAANAASVGTDLGYVRALIDNFDGILHEPRWAYKSWITIEIGRDDDRQVDIDSDKADEYCNLLYSSSPED